MDRDGKAIGSAFGDCAEGAVHDLCAQALQDGGSVVERVQQRGLRAPANRLTTPG
jgi:xanthine/CO dehydrogenase XdhC/CoxF family maturation factor